MTLEEDNARLQAELDRWTRRVKHLEARLDRITDLAVGHEPPRLHDPLGSVPRGHSVHVEAVEALAQAMIAKLDKNAHKRHWSEVPLLHLLQRLAEEVKELEEAPTLEDVRAEAVDIANFAMMIFERSRT